MTAISEYGRYVEWDVRNWATAPEFWARHTTQDIRRCEALEVGSRHGGLSLWLAQLGANVLCTDLEGPTDRARTSHEAAGVAHRIRYASLDVTDVSYADRFDVVMFKSVLGALGGEDRLATQAHAVAQLHRALRVGGELFFAENLAASPAHRFLRRQFVGWGRRWRYVSIPEMLGFLSPFREVTYRTVGLCGALGRNNRQRALLGAVDRAFLDRLVPESWRYIMIGVARK
jgi:SAM-dependent methyltransferase